MIIYYDDCIAFKKLELPTLGGHTPFCQAGCRAHLVKGSAVIWFNKFKNGTNRYDMFHGACPVLQGTKLSKMHLCYVKLVRFLILYYGSLISLCFLITVLAQAIEYIGQWNHYKCSLNQLE